MGPLSVGVDNVFGGAKRPKMSVFGVVFGAKRQMSVFECVFGPEAPGNVRFWWGIWCVAPSVRLRITIAVDGVGRSARPSSCGRHDAAQPQHLRRWHSNRSPKHATHGSVDKDVGGAQTVVLTSGAAGRRPS